MKYRKRQSKAVIRDFKLALTAEELADKQAKFAADLQRDNVAGAAEVRDDADDSLSDTYRATEYGDMTLATSVANLPEQERKDNFNDGSAASFQNVVSASGANEDKSDTANYASFVSQNTAAEVESTDTDITAFSGDSFSQEVPAVRTADISHEELEQQVRVSKLRNLLLRDVEAQDKLKFAEDLNYEQDSERVKDTHCEPLTAEGVNSSSSEITDYTLGGEHKEATQELDDETRSTAEVYPAAEEQLNMPQTLPTGLRNVVVPEIRSGASTFAEKFKPVSNRTASNKSASNRHTSNKPTGTEFTGASYRDLQAASYKERVHDSERAVVNRDFAKQRREASRPLKKIIMPDSPKYELPENHVDFDPDKVAVPNRVDVYKDKERTSILKEALSFLQIIVVAFVIAVIFVTFIAQRNIVDGNSMYPTLYNGDNLIIEKVSNYFTIPAQGTIVTFIRPKVQLVYDGEGANAGYHVQADESMPDTQLVKRVIAVPGDEVEIKNGRVYVNGTELIEDYLPKEVVTEVQFPDYAHVKLGEDEIYVLGDNRPHSSDSRSFGPVKIKSLIGRSLVRFYPFNRFGIPR